MANTTHGNFHPSALAAVNEALAVLGQDVTLTAETFSAESANAHGRKAAFLYEGARVKVLRDHAWTFARRELDVGPVPARGALAGGGFAFRFPRPPRCVRMCGCLGPDGRATRYRLGASDVQADGPVAKVVYTADVEDLDRWTPDAYRALVLRLAADLAKPITGRISERELQENAYRDQLEAAKLNDARETDVPYDAYADDHYVDAMLGHSSRSPFHDHRSPFHA